MHSSPPRVPQSVAPCVRGRLWQCPTRRVSRTSIAAQLAYSHLWGHVPRACGHCLYLCSWQAPSGQDSPDADVEMPEADSDRPHDNVRKASYGEAQQASGSSGDQCGSSTGRQGSGSGKYDSDGRIARTVVQDEPIILHSPRRFSLATADASPHGKSETEAADVAENAVAACASDDQVEDEEEMTPLGAGVRRPRVTCHISNTDPMYFRSKSGAVHAYGNR